MAEFALFRQLIRKGLMPDTASIFASRAGSAAMSIQCGFDTVNQDGSSERLGQQANGSGLQRSRADAVVGECCDENKGNSVALGTHMGQKVQTADTGHLYIRNDTRQVV
jgi:hypothetical protein